MAAFDNGQEYAARELLSHNALVDLQDNFGFTAQMMAVKNNSWVGYKRNSVYKLLDMTLDETLNIQNDEGMTVLIIAARNCNSGVVNHLLDQCSRNVLMDIQNRNGSTALMEAVGVGEGNRENLHSVKKLLDCGASVDLRDNDGSTALMIAANIGSSYIVKILLKYNATIDIQNMEGETALMMAAKTGSYQVVEELLKYNATVDIQNMEGDTALMLASRNGHAKVVSVLPRHIALLEMENKNGMTAGMMAEVFYLNHFL